MTETQITVSEALGDAADFARDAWRSAWAPMVLTAAGWTLIVVGDHAQLTGGDAGVLKLLGWLLLLFHLPLLGALYRSGLGGRALRGLKPGGLQLGGVEGRILAVNAILIFFFALACAPMMLVSGVFYVVLRRFDGVTLGPLGHWEWWFLVAALFWLGLTAALIYVSGRLALATPLSIERRRVLPLDAWPSTEKHGVTIAVAFVAAHIPTLLVWLGLQAFGWVEPDAPPVGVHGPWPLPDALAAGIIAGLGLSAVQAPLSVGLLTFFYDVLTPLAASAGEAAGTTVQTPDATAAGSQTALNAEPEGAPASEPEPEPEPDPDPPFSAVVFSPYTGRYSRLTTPPTAAQAAPAVPAPLTAADPEPADLAPDERAQPETGDEPYPHSAVEYSAETGRFSPVRGDGLTGEALGAAPDIVLNDAIHEFGTAPGSLSPAEADPAPEADVGPSLSGAGAPTPAEAAEPERPALDAADEPEHAKP